jgi:hypothetical protein
LNRALLLGTDDSEEQTRRILGRQAARYSGASPQDTEAIVRRHREFQASLKRRAVVIPFAERLMESIPAKKVEARRAGQQILSVIEAVTLLRQFVREEDAEGRLVATADDYRVAARVLRGPLGESLGVRKSAAALYDRLAEKHGEATFSTAEAQKLDGATDRSVRNFLAELAAHGCVDQVRPGKGPNPAVWRLNGKTPGETVLPAPADLFRPGSP